MLQITLQKPGLLTASEAAPPVLQDGFALVKVHRLGVCGTDIHAFAGRQPFFSYPRILGHELGVEVIAVSPNDLGISVGDRCCVEPSIRCGQCIACRRGRVQCCENLQVMGVHVDGGMREFFAVPLVNLHKSNKLTFDQLALVETLCIGAHAVDRAVVETGETVLVTGAGPIGLTVMQFAQAAGANVIAMDISEDRLRFCREALGVEKTVDASSGDVESSLRAVNNGDLPTCVFDATGFPSSMNRAFNITAHGGRIVFVGLFPGEVTFEDPNFHRRELTLFASRNSTPETFRSTIALIENGQIDTTPWITHRMALRDVAESFDAIKSAPGLIKAMIEN